MADASIFVWKESIDDQHYVLGHRLPDGKFVAACMIFVDNFYDLFGEAIGNLVRDLRADEKVCIEMDIIDARSR